MNVQEARSLLATARELDAFVVVAHTYLFHPAWPAVGSWVKERRITHLSSRGGNSGPFRADVPPLWDYGPHDVAMCIDLVGKVTSASARPLPSETSEDRGEVWELDLEMAGGIRSRLVVGNGMAARARRFEIEAGPETLIFDDSSPEALTIVSPAGVQRLEAETGPPPLDRVIGHFVDGIRSGSTDVSALELGGQVVEVLQRVSA
jgi:predicted dehydrogenase